MADLMRRAPEMFDPIRRFLDGDWEAASIRVEEFVDGQSLVVRAELPGIDPEKDVDVSVADGVLHIKAERQEKSEHKSKDSYRSEFRYGSFTRSLPLPQNVKEDDVTATYKDGVLEVRAPLPAESAAASRKVQINRS
ncbi:Hsp20/alpha crystallin family protein [Paenarthrobacter sp. DKR-5]|uniref:Hsp20/alpha crystallin family protein n=1 Tax=Paenarthrobacter sp. DKR-5 TaxID=2835535 RepID=UPI001BDCCA34|nr:Hsp20/alpha crystallin family protein [Paenarthrobacter sp. DKR-5]MBT1004407.1 Hsp20/alpha crystallin family protein [Paenarthrobacter sp. DKR-5]